jgi:small subunit ribosomal protein S20
MANHKSAEKAHRQSLKRAARNRSIKSRVKTFITHFQNALTSQNLETATTAFRSAEAELMKSVSKGVYHLNTASRKVSRLCQKLKQLEASK